MSDSKTIIFQSSRTGMYQLYLTSLEDANPEQITHDNSHNTTPSVSADRKKIAFVSHRGENAQVYLMNRDGTNLQQLTKTPQSKLRAEISPDGKKIHYTKIKMIDGERFFDICVVNTDGSEDKNLTGNFN